MSEPARYSRHEVVAWAAAGGVAGATVGGSIAWLVDNGMTADWFGAIGTWVGSIGTIATIGWGIITFRHQQQEKIDDRIAAEVARRENELSEAKNFTLTCRPMSWTQGVAERVNLEFANGLSAPVRVSDVRIGQSHVKAVTRQPVLVAQGETVKHTFVVVPSLTPKPGEDKATVSEGDVEMTYEIRGVRWTRTGAGDPTRT